MGGDLRWHLGKNYISTPCQTRGVRLEVDKNTIEYVYFLYMNTTSLHIKIDDSLKGQAQDLADQLGLSLSVVVKVLLKQFIRARNISVGLDEEPTEYFKQLMKQADSDVHEGRVTRFHSGKEALYYIDSLIADDTKKR